MNRKRLWCLGVWMLLVWSVKGQTYTFEEMGQTYPVGADGNKYAVSGFVSYPGQEDERIFGNALLWMIETVCPKGKEGIQTVNVPGRKFICNLVLGSLAGSGYNNTYYCEATFRVNEGKLVYYLSNVLIESSVFVMKKVTPMEKLQPEKKEAHRRMMDDFVQVESLLLNRLFDFVSANKLTPVTHWTEIGIGKPVKGMTEDECRLAFGKPQTILESNGEVQWMYNSSFYLFFKNGRVQTIIK